MAEVEERGAVEAVPRDDDELPATLRAAITDAYRVTIETSSKLVGLGDECDIWRVATAGDEIAVRVIPAWRNEWRLRWTYRLLAYLSTRVPEVVAPLETVDGKTLISWAGRFVAVFPWVAGAQLDDEEPDLRDAGARLLARLHNAMLLCAELPDAKHRPPVEPREDVLGDPQLDAELAEIFGDDRLLRGQIHGDYYPRNLICRAGRIVGVLDWDDSRRDLLMREFAWATWEFGQHPADADLDLERARRFLASYRNEGGPVRPAEDRNIIPLIRMRLRDEVRLALASPIELSEDDKEYTEREIAAFERLRGPEIDW